MFALTANLTPTRAAALTAAPAVQPEVVAIQDPQAKAIEDLAAWPAAAGR